MHPQIQDFPLTLRSNNDNYYYCRDGNGSVIALTSEGADVINSYKYYSFGQSKEKSEEIPNYYQGHLEKPSFLNKMMVFQDYKPGWGSSY